MNKDLEFWLKMGLFYMACLFILILSGFLFWATCVKLSLWSSSIYGQAELKKAEWNRQIVVREAQARLDSSIALAQAEVERAKGVAKANKIIGSSLKDNEQYLRYLWIDSLQHTQDKIIYIPTEAGMPILEAGKR